jgi:catechol 2,3-dioxygenase-like lactoylglutathione lyase family enzyme
MSCVVNSVIFHTRNLAENKSFYKKHFGFKVGTYEKDGKHVPDESETYFNFHVDRLLLCFDFGSHTDEATLVLHVTSLADFKNQVSHEGIEILKQTDFWLKINDPDGRTLIIEQKR